MTLGVLTAVVGSREAGLVSGLERSPAGVHVVRRCADLVELLSAAAAGLARAVVLSADLQRLDREAVVQLTEAGVAVIGLVEPADLAGAQLLRNLGVGHVLSAETSADDIAGAVATAIAELAAVQTRSPDRSWATGDPGAALPAIPAGRLADPLPRGRPPGHVLTVWGPPGSPGRTTVAVTLATELAASGHETLLIDADTHGASIAQSLGLLDESAGLAAAARAANQGGLDVEKLAELAPWVSERLRVLTGLPQSRRWPELRATALDGVWQQARELATWTVIDAGFGLEADEELMFDSAAPRRHGATLSAVTAADLVVAVGGAEPIGLQRLVSGLPDLAEVVPAGVSVQVVVTRVRDSAVGNRAPERIVTALERYAGIRDVLLIPDDRPGLDAAMLAGRSLIEQVPSSPARVPLTQLAARLVREAGPGDVDAKRERNQSRQRERGRPGPRRKRFGHRGGS